MVLMNRDGVIMGARSGCIFIPLMCTCSFFFRDFVVCIELLRFLIFKYNVFYHALAGRTIDLQAYIPGAYKIVFHFPEQAVVLETAKDIFNCQACIYRKCFNEC